MQNTVHNTRSVCVYIQAPSPSRGGILGRDLGTELAVPGEASSPTHGWHLRASVHSAEPYLAFSLYLVSRTVTLTVS